MARLLKMWLPMPAERFQEGMEELTRLENELEELKRQALAFDKNDAELVVRLDEALRKIKADKIRLKRYKRTQERIDERKNTTE